RGPLRPGLAAAQLCTREDGGPAPPDSAARGIRLLVTVAERRDRGGPDLGSNDRGGSSAASRSALDGRPGGGSLEAQDHEVRSPLLPCGRLQPALPLRG